MKARFYQKDALQNLEKNREQQLNDNLIVIPVGGGKSVVIAHDTLKILKDRPGKAILLSHRKELSTQNAEKLRTINPNLKIGFEKAQERCSKDDQIMVASVQSIGKAGIQRIRDWCDPKEISTIQIDEAHHIPGGKTYQVLLDELREANPEIAITGYTATPKRGDGERIDKYISNVAYQISMGELVESKYLARLIGKKVATGTSLETLTSQKKRKDFDDEALSKLVDNETRNHLALDIYMQKHRGEQSLAFCVNKAHAHNVCQIFQKAGIMTACITEDCKPKERDQLINAYKNGEIQVLTSCGVLTEGFDVPLIKSLLMLRPTKSPVLFEQMIGRALRLFATPNPADPNGEWLIDWEKKANAHIYDFVDQSAIEAGAYNLAKMLDLNPEFDMDQNDAFATKARIDAETQNEPLLAAAIHQAHSLEEIDALLQEHNILAEIQAIKHVPNQNLSWMEINYEESWIILAQGEQAKVWKNAVGQYELILPEIDLEAREKSREEWLQRNPDRTAPDNIPKEITHPKVTTLGGDTLKDALKEASQILEILLPCDQPLLKANATWKQKGHSQPASQAQKEMLNRLNPIHPEDLEKLNKSQASDLINKAKLQRSLMAKNGRITYGQYKGAPAPLIQLYDPDYLQWLSEHPKHKPRLQQEGLLEHIKQAQKENPLPWLKSYRPALYKKDFEGMEEFYKKEFEKNPEDVYQVIRFALDHESVPPWPLILKRAIERKPQRILKKSPLRDEKNLSQKRKISEARKEIRSEIRNPSSPDMDFD